MNGRKTILVTGATGGIGYHVAKRLLSLGYTVVATGRSVLKLEELKGLGAVTIDADLTVKEERDTFLHALPALEGAVFAAGFGLFKYAEETEEQEVRKMFDINVFSVMELSRELLKRNLGIHLVYVGSMAGKVATPKAAAYAASKHALLGYANALRLETKGRAVVSVINSGPVDTGFLDLADSSGRYRKTAKSFLLQPDKVADRIIRVINKPVREVNMPGYLNWSSKFHALWPALTERVGNRFFTKK